MFFRLVLIIVITLIETAAHAGATAVIKQSDVKVSSDRILLKDVAVVSGAFGAKAAELENLYIKRSAVPGYTAVLTKEYITNKVEKAFPGTQVTGPERISVLTLSEVVKASDVRQHAEELIRANMPWKEDDAKIIIKGRPSDKSVPEGGIVLKAREPDSRKYRGNIVVPVDIEIDGRYYRTEPVSALIEVNAGCFYADADIKKGSRVTAAEVREVKQELTFLPDDIITEVKFFNNVSAKRPVAKGTLLTAAMFEKTAMFNRGDTVRIIAALGNAVVETTGTAKSAGREGETVEVTAVTGKSLKGIVNAEGSVIIQSK